MKSETLSFKIPEELVNKLKEDCEKDERTVSAMLRIITKKHYEVRNATRTKQ